MKQMNLKKVLCGGTLMALAALPLSAQAVEPGDMTYETAKNLVENPPANLAGAIASAPKVYSFPNADNIESVNYIGQTFRQILINDIKAKAYEIKLGQFMMADGKGAEAVESVFRFHAQGLTFDPAIKDDKGREWTSELAVNKGSSHKVSIKPTPGQAALDAPVTYGEVYDKGTSLAEKMAGADNDLRHGELLGWKAAKLGEVVLDANSDGKLTPTELVDGMIQSIGLASGANHLKFMAETGRANQEEVVNAAILPSGVDTAQMLQKFLHGALAFSQGMGDYMSTDLGTGKGLLADNTAPYRAKDGTLRPFTALQHHWDEAFGYFGAARDYANYTDSDIAKGYSLDSFSLEFVDGGIAQRYVGPGAGDFEVSLEHEKNFGLAINAAKRDLGVGGLTDFTGTIFKAFLEGRALMSQPEQPNTFKQLQAYSLVIGRTWEQVIAATVIHYINKLSGDYDNYGTQGYKFVDLAKHFSEMKGFALAFQFHPKSAVDKAQFLKLHELMGDAPFVPRGEVSAVQSSAVAAQQKLAAARDILAQVFGFTADEGFSPEILENW